MRGPQGAAEPARYVLLGLLFDGPAHGYDLARAFAPGTALGEVIHLTPSHLYAMLNRLDRDGLIEGERQEVGAHPPRRVYRLTGTGREAVLHWIEEPVGHSRDMRIDFPLKFYLARKIAPERAAILIEHQRHIFTDLMERVEYQPVSTHDDEDAAFVALVREARVGRLRAALEWLDRCEDLQPVSR